MLRFRFWVECDRCENASPAIDPGRPPKDLAFGREELDGLVAARGWESNGRGAHFCPTCLAYLRKHEGRPAPARSGFTLMELLAVLAIVGIVAVAALPVVLDATARAPVRHAASLLHGELTAAVARAQRDGVAGIRLVPDPAFPVARLADGSVDPAAPLAYSRIAPLVQPGGIKSGLVSIRDSFPPGFPALGTKALVLEQEVARDEGGARLLNEPTDWAWRVRQGDILELRGRTYAICGPVAQANPDGFVNYPGGVTGLDRGDGWAEWLLLVNGIDDDGDGWVDNGYDGRDQNLDGVPDDPAEWTEVETWGVTGQITGSPYLIRPRPAPASNGQGIEIAGALIDASGWAATTTSRSRLPVDRLSGYCDLTVWPDGRVEPVGRYAPTVPAVGLLSRPFLHFWVCPRESVDSQTPDVGELVTVNARTGLLSGGQADPADPAASYRAAEGGRE